MAPTEVVEVEGPDITKLLKSNLIWQTLELHLQISAAQAPLAKLEASKYVQFSAVDAPHPKVNVQQTP